MGTKTTPSPDLAQRIAEAVARTTVPAPQDGYKLEKGEMATELGTLPPHLQHMQNLLTEMGAETAEREKALRESMAQLALTRQVFFKSLHEHFPQPEGADSIAIMDDWKVAAIKGSDEDDNPILGLIDLFGHLFGGEDRRRRAN